MCRVIFLRSNSVMPDPRVEKEVLTLLKKGKDVKILAWNREKNLKLKKEIKKIDEYQCEIINLGIKAGYGLGFKQNLIPLIKFQLKILKYLYLNRKNIDIIHACDFDTVIPAYIISRLFNKKYIYDIFDYYVDAYSVPNKLKKIVKYIDNYMITNANHVILCTEKRIEQINKNKNTNITIVHNSPKKIIFDGEKIESQKLKICYVGILGKGRLLKELMEVISENKNYELHIGGFGNLDVLVKEFSERYKNIKYYGRLEYSKTLNLEAKCDVMLALYDPKNRNHYYAAPNKFYEALMLGKPLIMAENTGMTEVIEKLKCGELIHFSKEGLKLGLDKLVTRKNEFYKMKNKMQREYEENYSWEIMEKRILKIYEEI